GGGFFDTPQSCGPAQLGVLGAPRKPFQDSPTPAGNPAAAIALLRLHALTDEGRYHDKAEETLELIASVAGQYGIFAGTYALAGVALSEPHSQIVIVGGDELADRLYAAAVKNFSPNRAVLKFAGGQLVENNLPPALTQTLANLTAIRSNQSLALVCTGQACQPPISDSDELLAALEPAKNTWAGAKK
ncbi:MAG TPA: thioredoxin domain-containing protein, partial [Terriglobales bacterium]